MNDYNLSNHPHIKLDLFGGRNSYVLDCSLFFLQHGTIPCKRIYTNLDPERTIRFIETYYSQKIVQKIYREVIAADAKKPQLYDYVYQLDNGIQLNTEQDGGISVCFKPEQEDEANSFGKLLMRRAKKINDSSKCFIYLVSVRFSGSTELQPLTLPSPKLMLSENYDESLGVLHKRLIRIFKQTKQQGIILLHGVSGTGKTTYLQYLLSRQPRKVILLSPNMAEQLDSPSFTKLLAENQQCILLIEDAESLITARQRWRNSSMATLLNLSDGLAGRSLGTIIIATFNAAVREIDAALMRKGRLLEMYEFKPLSVQKANRLLEIRGIKGRTNKPMTLADIYNYESKETSPTLHQRSTIGFNAHKAS